MLTALLITLYLSHHILLSTGIILWLKYNEIVLLKRLEYNGNESWDKEDYQALAFMCLFLGVIPIIFVALFALIKLTLINGLLKLSQKTDNYFLNLREKKLLQLQKNEEDVGLNKSAQYRTFDNVNK